MNPEILISNADYQNLITSNTQKSLELYKTYRDENDQAIRIGIFGEDLDKALINTDNVYLQITGTEYDDLKMPTLVPIENLDWYNLDLLKRKYGNDVKAMVYIHPPILNENAKQLIIDQIQKKIDEGYTIISEHYQGEDDDVFFNYFNNDKDHQLDVEAFGADTESRVDVFVGKVAVNGISDVNAKPDLINVYESAIENGEVTHDPYNGVSIVASIEGAEADRIWDLYEKPFEGLGVDEPFQTGFDKETLLEILSDNDTIKVINRVDGTITTLMIFLQDFEKAPWFNKEFYRKNYSDYFATKNIFMFPGIVTDENMRGNNYATDVIDLTNAMFAKRGSSFLVTFECTDLSSTYVPKIVEAAVNKSGVASIEGLEQPVSQIYYYAVKKKN